MPYKDRERQKAYWRDRYRSKAIQISAQTKIRYQQKREEYLSKNKKYRAANKERIAARAREKYLADREKILARNKTSYQKHKQNHVAGKQRWVERNALKVRDIKRRWEQANPDQRRAQLAKRKAALVQAIPKWADFELIKRVYREAVRLAAKTGVKYHVDHIVPLRNERVCGLHVHYNLRPIPMAENLKKSNKLLGY